MRLACAATALVLAAGTAFPSAAAPAARNGAGSLSGVWHTMRFNTARRGPPSGEVRLGTTDDGGPIPLQPWAAKVVQERIASADSGRPFAGTEARCLPGGTPSSMSPPANLPLQIIESPGQVTVLVEEFNHFRIIRMANKHEDDPDPGYFGDSIAHWEGKTLVVDTIALTTETSIDRLVPHSEDLHVVERFRRIDPNTLEIKMTVEDPKTFTRPWTRTSRFQRIPGARVREYFCQNDRNPPDAHGASGVVIPATK